MCGRFTASFEFGEIKVRWRAGKHSRAVVQVKVIHPSLHIPIDPLYPSCCGTQWVQRAVGPRTSSRKRCSLLCDGSIIMILLNMGLFWPHPCSILARLMD